MHSALWLYFQIFCFNQFNLYHPFQILNSNLASKGSATKGVYFDANGVAQPMTYSLAKSVPSTAVFTDTKYSAGTGLSLSGTTFATNLDAKTDSGFLRIAFPTTDGVKYVIVGSVTKTINISTPYGNEYIGDFTISIPSSLRFTTPLAVSVHCQAAGRVVTCGRSGAIASQVTGWVQSACSGSASVTMSLIYWGY